MGGWPSTTGNPSGGGRWNNEEDDGYDDYDDCDGGAPVSEYKIPGPSRSELRQNRFHNRRMMSENVDAMCHAYNNNEHREELNRKIRQLKKKISEIRCVKSDYIAREYFGEESYEALLDTILRPLAETCHKITVMKSDNTRGPNLLNIMQYPKLSKEEHVLITEGYMYWHGGKYLFKSDWDDDSEDLTVVMPDNYRPKTEVITAETIQLFNDKKQEFLGLLVKKDEELARYMEYVALGFMSVDVRWQHDPKLPHFVLKEWLPDLYGHPYHGPQKWRAHKPTSGPLVDIKAAMDKDVLELESEMERLQARLTEIKEAFEKKVEAFKEERLRYC